MRTRTVALAVGAAAVAGFAVGHLMAQAQAANATSSPPQLSRLWGWDYYSAMNQDKGFVGYQPLVGGSAFQQYRFM